MTWDDYMRQHGEEVYALDEAYRQRMIDEGHKEDCAAVVWFGDCTCEAEEANPQSQQEAAEDKP